MLKSRKIKVTVAGILYYTWKPKNKEKENDIINFWKKQFLKMNFNTWGPSSLAWDEEGDYR